MNKSRRVVLVSAKPIAGRAWKSLMEDECVETSKDQSAAQTGKTLRLTQCNKPPYQPVASAGSLAVIFQPAFVPLPIGAVTATVMLIDSIGAPATAGMQSAAATQDATLIGLAYAAGPISIGLDHTAFGQNAAAATATDSRTRVSASYNLGVATVGAGYQTKETYAGLGDTQMMFGVSVPMGAITLGATYASKDSDNNAVDATGWELGANYAFSKRTNLQTAYLIQSINDGADATHLRVRLMHSF
jgi:hypothetical protein